MTTEIQTKKSVELSPQDRFKATLHKNYLKQIQASLWEKKWMEFFTWAIYLVQKTPKLLDVNQSTLFNAIMQTMELRLPIWPTWEVYILPYWKEAQFQLWYKWIITLLYRWWVQSIRAEIVYEKDNIEIINWNIKHKIDFTKSTKQRWEAIWCYVIAKLNWEEISKYMHREDIFKFKAFSKSAWTSYSPWNEKNDPELNMWKKTVIKQLSKLLPQNETLAKAIEVDNQDSTIWDEEINALDNNEALAKTLEWFWEWEEWENKNIS